MRPTLAFALLLAACSQKPTEPSIDTGIFAGQGRDRLCIAGEGGALRAGLIAYGLGDTNCSASGNLQPAGQGWVLIPKGEGDCRIPLEIDGNTVKIGQAPAACAYYCGPTANMAGKAFNRADMGSQAVDLAGDPLC
jgi:hypothetical protein